MLKLTVTLLAFTSLALTACQKKTETSPLANYIEADGKSVDRKLVSDGVEFRVVSQNVLTQSFAIDGSENQNTQLILGFPRQLLGQQNVFGGVVTAASDTQDEGIGGLKLSDISPLHVKTVLSEGGTQLILQGCQKDCDENAALEELFKIPVVKQDDQFVYLDLTAFGSQLDFLKSANPEESEPMTATATVVKRFDFSLSTLVFDVENTYVIPEPAKTFTLTTRWYLKLASGFNPNFTSRPQTEGVGYFTTARNKTTLITRFAGSTTEKSLVKYYIKNVPQAYRQAFADGFEDWNKKLAPVLGKDFYQYEFLETTDPRYNQIIPGDVRFNVLEWDLVNKAGYGGLGPSIASQVTGETFSANTLIQGPTIIELYTKWWKVSAQVKQLLAEGKTVQAEKVRVQFAKEISKKLSAKKAQTKLTLASLKFNMNSLDPRLSDAALDPSDFIELAPGYNYETYMYGYFRDMVSHELGHNMGLRHNFKGNLGATDDHTTGSVSRSIMEYLGRLHRHLDRVGEYDVMAIAYGYKGTLPAHKNWFCTDDNQVDNENVENSAECSTSDATKDPFSFLLSRLHRAQEFILLPGSELTPVWTTDVLVGQIAPIATTLVNYYVSSFATAKDWTNFMTSDRAMPVAQVPDYILKTLQTEVCGAHLDAAVAQKKDSAKEVATKNLKAYRAFFKELTKDYKKPVESFTDANFACWQ